MPGHIVMERLFTLFQFFALKRNLRFELCAMLGELFHHRAAFSLCAIHRCRLMLGGGRLHLLLAIGNRSLQFFPGCFELLFLTFGGFFERIFAFFNIIPLSTDFRFQFLTLRREFLNHLPPFVLGEGGDFRIPLHSSRLQFIFADNKASL